MKSFLLHGDDNVRSYERLTKFIDSAKKRNWELNFVDDTNTSFRDVFASTSLFGGERFFILKKVKKIPLRDLEWLGSHAEKLEGTLIIYDEGVVGKTILEVLPKDIAVETFTLPVIIWSFLEGIYPGSLKNTLNLFHKLLENNPPEFLLPFVAKHFRKLYWATNDPGSLKVDTWKMDKLKKQAEKFKDLNLALIIFKLSEIDIASKTGRGDLVSLLDLFFVEILE